MIRIPQLKTGNREHGSSLLEVMVALLILSIGLLGLALLQMRGLKFNTDAYLRSQATLLADDIMERMRTNPGAGNAYTGAVPALKPAPDCRTTTNTNGCTAAQLVAHDLWVWNQAIQSPSGIPGATGVITAVSGAANRYLIEMSWIEQGKVQGSDTKLKTPTFDVQQAWVLQL